MALSVEQYLKSLPEDRRATMRRFYELISKAVPKFKPKIWNYSGNLIGWGTYHYKYDSGREGDWYVLGLANRKAYISIYSLGVVDGKYLTEKYHSRLPGTKIGKSCINVTKPELLENKVIAELANETAQLFPKAR